jgi:hypothetical protein
MPEIYPDNAYGDEYLERKRRKIRDEDRDGMDDDWEQKVGLHDEFNRHRRPHLNVGGALKSHNGIIAFDHDFLTPLKSPKQSLTISSPKTIKLSLEFKNPPLKSSIDSTGIENFLDRIMGKKKKIKR